MLALVLAACLAGGALRLPSRGGAERAGQHLLDPRSRERRRDHPGHRRRTHRRATALDRGLHAGDGFLLDLALAAQRHTQKAGDLLAGVASADPESRPQRDHLLLLLGKLLEAALVAGEQMAERPRRQWPVGRGLVGLDPARAAAPSATARARLPSRSARGGEAAARPSCRAPAPARASRSAAASAFA